MPPKATATDYAAAAALVPANPRIFRALCTVESLGSGFDDTGRPTMLVEPHIIWRYATPAQREVLYPEKLAYPKAGTYPYGKYSEQAAKFDRISHAVNQNLAILGTSFGLLQIIGDNWQMAGASSPQHFYSAMCESEASQLDAAANFMEALRMARYMGGAPNFSMIAMKWNGSGNVQRYAAKLETVYHATPS